MDKELLEQAIIDVLDCKHLNHGELTRQWRFYADDFKRIGLDVDELPFERADFARTVIKRYFHLVRVELAKDGN